MPIVDKKGMYEKELKVVRMLAVTLRRSLRLGKRIELEELVSFGAVGLGEALARYDASRCCSFRTWARWRIVGAMYDGLRRHGILRRGRDVAREAARGEITVRPPERPDAFAGPEGLPDPKGGPYEALERKDMRARLQAALEALDGRERRLLDEYYWRERQLRSIAREIGISLPWASRLHTRAVSRLRDALGVEQTLARAGGEGRRR